MAEETNNTRENPDLRVVTPEEHKARKERSKKMRHDANQVIMEEQYDTFADDWDVWKEENSELYEEMLANPEEYGIDTQTREWETHDWEQTDFLQWTKEADDWEYSAATAQQLEANIMNIIG